MVLNNALERLCSCLSVVCSALVCSGLMNFTEKGVSLLGKKWVMVHLYCLEVSRRREDELNMNNAEHLTNVAPQS